MRKILLEAPVYTVEAALKASAFGVERLELCADFGEGGTTPSAGLLKLIKSKINTPVFVMIRPRGGDFVYEPEELEAMRNDIQVLKSHGAEGFVFGVLDEVGQVDKAACKYLLEAAEGMPCTFHRAFDITVDKKVALEEIVSLGFKRILTSGGENTVSLGLENIKSYMDWAAGRIIIMPGGGSRSEHVHELKNHSAFQEIHASCKGFRPSKSRFVYSKVSLSSDPEMFKKVLTVDEFEVLKFKKAIS